MILVHAWGKGAPNLLDFLGWLFPEEQLVNCPAYHCYLYLTGQHGHHHFHVAFCFLTALHSLYNFQEKYLC